MGKWYKAQQKATRKMASKEISITVNGQPFKDLKDADLRKIARKAGFSEVTTIATSSFVAGKTVPVTQTITISGASRLELLTLLGHVAK